MNETIVYGVLVGLLILAVFQSFQISELKGNLVKAAGSGLSLSGAQGALAGGISGGSLAASGSDMSSHHQGRAAPAGAGQVGGC